MFSRKLWLKFLLLESQEADANKIPDQLKVIILLVLFQVQLTEASANGRLGAHAQNLNIVCKVFRNERELAPILLLRMAEMSALGW